VCAFAFPSRLMLSDHGLGDDKLGILRTEGFDRLLATVVEEATLQESAYEAGYHVATIGGRLAPEIGLGALSHGELRLMDALLETNARTDPSAGLDAHRLAVTTTGKLCVLRPGQEVAPGMTVVTGVDGAFDEPEIEPDGTADAARWLRAQPAERVEELLRHLRFTLLHVGPMRVYIGNDCYTNLGREGNLVGKSIAADSDRCTLKTLTERPVEDWSDADASFVVCMSILISSGTPSRTEEFSGTQLSPVRLEDFLTDRLRAYDAEVPDTAPGIDRLFDLANRSRTARLDKVKRATVYRTVQSMTINKREHFFDHPVTEADLPEHFKQAMAELPDWTALFGTAPEQAGFSTRFEEAVHHLVRGAAHATGTHVSMSRGPRDPMLLNRLIAEGSTEPGHWKTSEYYCCVVPSDDFVLRFTEVPEELPQVIRAIAARMRWNGWHFMPHAAGVSDDPSFADRDWFYAPSMPDMTEWTSHHHQGHVANGVRHAIRIPLPLTLAGTSRSGVHDLRLMRTDGDPYRLEDLRAAVAMGEILRQLYQAHTDWLLANGRDYVVTDFGNTWYQSRYAPEFVEEMAGT